MKKFILTMIIISMSFFAFYNCTNKQKNDTPGVKVGVVVGQKKEEN